MVVKCYITFPSTYCAIRAESLLKQKTFPYKMVPVPRAISSSCGTALRGESEDIFTIADFLLQHDLDMEGIYRLEESGMKMPIVKELNFEKK
jgi:hypothetical protein